jgi:hypothetical protein
VAFILKKRTPYEIRDSKPIHEGIYVIRYKTKFHWGTLVIVRVSAEEKDERGRRYFLWQIRKCNM